MTDRTPEQTGGGNEAPSMDTESILRRQVDALDAAIQALVLERSRVSKRIQVARLAVGGTRIQLGRESSIRRSYAETLGQFGTHVADAILEVGRGPIAPLPDPTARPQVDGHE